MTTVLILSFGPVQDFIAAARRSRDLWSGSWLLSEVCKAAALALYQLPGVELVFPAVAKTDPNALLQPNSLLSVANKLQANLAGQPSAEQIGERIQQARQAAQRRLSELAAETKSCFNTRRADTGLMLNNALWHKQLIDYLECYAGWATQDEQAKISYSQAVRRANLALQARKATRDFAQLASHRDDAAGFGLPKSSLDGARETVLAPAPNTEPEPIHAAFQRELKLGLNPGEQLDCMGLIKRLAVKAEQFTPVSRIAADSWLRQLPDTEQDRLRMAYEAVYQAGKQLAGTAEKDASLLGLASRVTGNSGDYQTLPFDGALLYRARLAVAQRELKNLTDDHLNALAEKLTTLADTLTPIWRAYGEPTPYMAVLQADGDQMGALLEHIGSPEHHQQVSRALADFAGGAAEVARKHHGHVIYAGGDDVLALVPLDQAWACADALRKNFAHILAACIKKIPLDLPHDHYPTLSVGLGIGHMQETLNTLRDLAKRAEKLAKEGLTKRAEQLAKGNQHTQPRNALGIYLRSRNNAELSLRRRWDDHDGQKALQQWQQGFLQQLLPSRLAHDALALVEAGERARHSAAMLEAEFIRLFARTEFRSDPTQIAENSSKPEIQAQARAHWQRCLKDRLATLHKQHSDSAARELAHELYVSHWLASKTRQDLGELA
ncbi:type III-B CRISPR-associated protein Cas10/Cmr2 [Aquaspirillum sp. LM1]|uniref:type III-B CRISPR-associated protein Cas10/Cmr2 n=1 Tax=Aquaspirillum sp. LM1 TaxID=1938604 RepID=UPI0009839FA4|nr:type III-B CRISPR-associated protein Cas10/Cmr2 [Aquaspirillum sp. LM1]AQR64910.1 type III-B CRISPR-associated protein Cas10/Cmr2 [Aquaspirillum sp. LM1]